MGTPDSTWLMFDELALEAKRVWKEFHDLLGEDGPPPSAWRPPVDVTETANEIVIRVDLPGVRPPDVRVRLCGNVVTVTGVRQLPSCESGCRLLRKELNAGPFSLALRLPFVPDVARARGTLELGCLAISIPRDADPAPPRRTVLEIRI
jgi:HSP20 family protein